MYKCSSCGKEIEVDPEKRKIICAFCGYRTLRKTRLQIARRVLSR